jgi:chemotaxis protein CheX
MSDFCISDEVVEGLDYEKTLLEPFYRSTLKIFQVQANTQIEAKPPTRNAEGIPAGMNIAGILNMNSTDYVGTMGMYFPKEVFLSIYNNMFEEENTEIDDDIADAAGELVNMVYGAVKTELNDGQGHSFQPTIPTVAKGDNISSAKVTDPQVLLPFVSEKGTFYIELRLIKKD